jgi:hypothetical protein
MDDFTGSILVTPTPIKSIAPYDRYFQERGARIDTIENPERLLRVVATERATFASAPLLPGWMMLQKADRENLGRYGFAPHGPLMCSLAFSRSNPRTAYLKSAFEKGMQEITDNGDFYKVLEGYWGEDNVPREVLPESIRHQGTRDFDPERIPPY